MCSRTQAKYSHLHANNERALIADLHRVGAESIHSGRRRYFLSPAFSARPRIWVELQIRAITGENRQTIVGPLVRAPPDTMGAFAVANRDGKPSSVAHGRVMQAECKVGD
ncbi:hypothetical protein J6590_072236 [Homalodisca vitripennis]|nr:hypothetical protein J6590_072236 [Homalodisca vitripennis]